ncbi:MAG TPA: hypothetical protein DHW78_02770 [Ruminococcaceae bacterium]|nr:hypothetical protein [Oscillospiraceae bacterium]
MPAVSMPRAGSGRICLLHRNVPNTISKAAGKVAGMGINIENMQSKSRKEYAYTILDVTGVVTQQAVDGLCSLEEVIRARVIR